MLQIGGAHGVRAPGLHKPEVANASCASCSAPLTHMTPRLLLELLAGSALHMLEIQIAACTCRARSLESRDLI